MGSIPDAPRPLEGVRVLQSRAGSWCMCCSRGQSPGANLVLLVDHGAQLLRILASLGRCSAGVQGTVDTSAAPGLPGTGSEPSFPGHLSSPALLQETGTASWAARSSLPALGNGPDSFGLGGSKQPAVSQALLLLWVKYRLLGSQPAPWAPGVACLGSPGWGSRRTPARSAMGSSPLLFPAPPFSSQPALRQCNEFLR